MAQVLQLILSVHVEQGDSQAVHLTFFVSGQNLSGHSFMHLFSCNKRGGSQVVHLVDESNYLI